MRATQAFFRQKLFGRLVIAGLLMLLPLAACDRGPSGPVADPAAAEAARRDQALAEREARLDGRAADLDRRATDLDGREAELDRTAAELSEREKAAARREAALASREAKLGSREQAVAQAELAAESRAAELAAREREAAELARRAELAARRPEPPPPPVRQQVLVTVPAGAELEVQFLDRLSSAVSLPGDPFRTRVVRDLYLDGQVAVPAGSEVLGRVIEARPTKTIGGRGASLALEFERLVLPSGRSADLAAGFASEGRGGGKRDAATIGGAAAGGAVLGRIIDRRHKTKGTVLGALIGAALGTAIAAGTPNEEVEIPEGTIVGLVLSRDVYVSVERLAN